MTDKPFPWANDWMDYQRKYWDALNALTPQDSKTSAEVSSSSASINPWADALDKWWVSASSLATPPVQEFYSRLIEQGKSYFGMVEGLNQALQTAAATGQSLSQWQEAMSKTFDSMKTAFTVPARDVQANARKMMGLWELPLENWERMASSMSATPGDLLQDINVPDAGIMRESIKGRLDQFLSAPGVGHMRERQDQFQELTRLWINYQESLHDYARSFSDMGVKSVERLQGRFGKLIEEGKELKSLRDIYDLWVDCCEESYADYVTTDDYVEINGRMVNSLMAFKRHSRMMIDEVLGALNMPTRREMETLHSRFHQLRRQEKATQKDIEKLKAQLSVMESKQPKPAAAKRRVTSRPKAAAAKRKAASSPKSAGMKSRTTRAGAAKVSAKKQ